jgi:hypothetical protein
MILTEKYYVYWLHLPEHTDILTEGYVGITKNPVRRFYQHKYKNLNRKFVDEGSKQYCREVEYKLRPRANIGLNINPGGMIPVVTTKRREVARHRMLTDNPMKKLGVIEKNSGCYKLGDPRLCKKRKPRADVSERNRKISYCKGKPWSEARRMAQARKEKSNALAID